MTKIIKRRRGYYVPEDIQKEILSRLPVKSLVRFQTVNRTLQRLISTQQFITDHQKTFRCEEDELLVLGRGQWSQIWCNLFLDGRFLKHIEHIGLPNEPLSYRRITTVGCCNGVVCLICHGTNELLFMNPSIRKVVVIPASDYLSGEISILSFGFGYVEDDYKLIVLPSVIKSGTSLMANVFSLKSRNWVTVAYSWSQPQDPYYQKWIMTSETPVFVDGACHWLAERWDQGRMWIEDVLSFNLSGDPKIGKMVLPIFHFVLTLNAYDGRLCVIVDNDEIWAMNKGDSTWTRMIQCSMKWVDSWTGQPFVQYKMVGFLSGGNVLFSRKYSLDNCTWVELICYDPTTKIKRPLKKYNGSEIFSLDHSYAYRQNLVLLDQDI